MRELHVVAVSEDGRHVLLAGKRGSSTGGFRVAIDDQLLAAVRGDLPRPGEDPHAASDLTPKEIQARLRAGESAESIALSAGVPVLRVERFSGPVQGEMARMIDAARSAHLVRGRLGRSDVPLGVAVDQTLAKTPSLRPESVEWETRREDDGRWLVTVSWFARARTRSASWHYHPSTRTVVATDPTAAALAHRDQESAEPAKAPARKASARKAPTKKAPTKGAQAKKAPAKQVKAAATKTPVRKVAAKRAPATKAAPTPKPTKRVAAKKAPAKKAPLRAPAKRVASKVPTRATRTLRVVPDPEPRRPSAPSPAERDGVKVRASVPGWADVLLGTSPGNVTRDDR